MSRTKSSIGVVIVTFDSSDVISGCLDSLLAQGSDIPHIIVVDNASTDATVDVVRRWAERHADGDEEFLIEYGAGDRPADLGAGRITLIHARVNRGFAGGVNLGLAALHDMGEIAHFWLLNPDAEAAPDAAAAILHVARETPDYGLIGGRVCYAAPSWQIQSDGGRVNFWTGVAELVHLGARAAETEMPSADSLDFVVGSSMVASRRFYERVGPMPEDYFLYYEETDWALRRGDLKIVIAPDFLTYHHTGTSIGSPTLTRLATPFSIWFLYRNRMRFIRRFNPVGLPVAFIYAAAKAGQLLLQGANPQASALLRAILGLPAPQAVRERLSPGAAQLVFGRAARAR